MDAFRRNSGNVGHHCTAARKNGLNAKIGMATLRAMPQAGKWPATQFVTEYRAKAGSSQPEGKGAGVVLAENEKVGQEMTHPRGIELPLQRQLAVSFQFQPVAEQFVSCFSLHRIHLSHFGTRFILPRTLAVTVAKTMPTLLLDGLRTASVRQSGHVSLDATMSR